jgi:hypothetical protein
VLPTPCQTEDQTGSVMRRSKRIAAQPASSAKPAERARGTKLKRLGLADAPTDPKEAKKQQLLLAYDGPDKAAADEALSELFAVQTKAT